MPAITSFTWSSATSGDWSAPGDWIPSGPPSSTGTAFINATGSAYTITVGLSLVSVGTIDVNSLNATLSVLGTLDINAAGSLDLANGNVAVQSGGTLNAQDLLIGAETGDTATLTINAGGVVTGAGSLMDIGTGTSATGVVAISGTLSGVGGIDLGGPGNGTITVNSGGQFIINGGSTIASQFGSDSGGGGGTLIVNGGTVSDTGADLDVGGALGSNGSILIENGGQFTSINDNGNGYNLAADIDAQGATASAEVETGGTWIANGQINVADNNTGTLDINDGLVNAGTYVVYVGGNAGGSGTITVENHGTLLAGDMSIGDPYGPLASGTLTVGTAGTVDVGSITEGGDSTIAVNGGTLITAGIIVGGTGGSIATTASLVVVSQGLVDATGGFLSVGATNAAGVVTVVSGGTLLVDSATLQDTSTLALSGGIFGDGSTSVTVDDTSVVQGAGTIDGAVNLAASTASLVASGGSLEVVGTISGTGTATLGSGSTFQIDAVTGNTATMAFASGTPETLVLSDPLLNGAGMFTAVTGFASGDLMDFGSGISITSFSTTDAGGGVNLILNVSESSSTGTITIDDVQLAGGATGFAITNNNGDAAIQAVPCFAAGTRIATVRGDVAVEDLRVGDWVQTALGGMVEPIMWIGRREVNCAMHARPRNVWPVRIAAGAFGDGAPHTDLFLSPDHAVYVNEVLVPVKHLVNGSTIKQMPVDTVTYYHVELPQHDVVLAEGLTVESYLDQKDGSNYAHQFGPGRLSPDYAARMWEAFGCAPLVVRGPSLEAARRVVATRAVGVPIAA